MTPNHVARKRKKCKWCLSKTLCDYYKGDYGKGVVCEGKAILAERNLI